MTITGRALVDAVPPTAYLGVDDLRHFVGNGHAAPWGGDQGSPPTSARGRDATGLARSFRAAGFNVAITDVATSGTLALYRRLLPDIVVVHLVTPLAEARRCASTRPVTFPRFLGHLI